MAGQHELIAFPTAVGSVLRNGKVDRPVSLSSRVKISVLGKAQTRRCLSSVQWIEGRCVLSAGAWQPDIRPKPGSRRVSRQRSTSQGAEATSCRRPGNWNVPAHQATCPSARRASSRLVPSLRGSPIVAASRLLEPVAISIRQSKWCGVMVRNPPGNRGDTVAASTSTTNTRGLLADQLAGNIPERSGNAFCHRG